MDIELQLKGFDAKERTIFDLQDWIKRERIKGLHVQPKTTPPGEEQMGIAPETILSIVLGSTAVVELVKSLHVWLQMRRPKLKVKLKKGDNEIEIDAENLPELEKTIDRVIDELKMYGGE